MGTRNMTMVINQLGETKVAQYGQWDGYPSGVGAGLLELLKNAEAFSKLKENLSKVRFIDEEGQDKDFVESYNKNAPEWSNDPDNRTPEQIEWWGKYGTRDLAYRVLYNIAESTEDEILIFNREETAKEDGWVDFSYVVNLQDNTFSVYELLDKPVIKVYNLSELPDENDFIKEIETLVYGEPEADEE
jgi:hypothetical protein